MEFTLNKNDIKNALSIAKTIASRNTNLAITSTVLIQTIPDGVKVSATDLETSYQGVFNTSVNIEGAIAIDAKKFFEIVDNFPYDGIFVTEKENRFVKIWSDKIEYNIACMGHHDFPELPDINDTQLFDVDSLIFKEAIENVLIIKELSDDKRAHVMGVNFERFIDGDDNFIRFVSTDGMRLSKMDCKLDGKVQFQDTKNILIPKAALREIKKILDNTGTVEIGVNDNSFIVKKGNENIIVNLLEGDFPNYEQVIQTDGHNSIVFDKDDLSRMIKRMSIFCPDNFKNVIFYFKHGELEITTTNPEIGESKEVIKIDFDKEIKVVLNPMYVLDVLKTIKEKNIILYVADNKKPVVVKGVDNEDYLSIIMPMKVD